MPDLIIIGAGPAGITASVYAARKRLDLLVISQDIGGQAAWSGDIENYTGYQFITGPELARKFEEHMRKFEIALKESETVLDVSKQDNVIKVKTSKEEYEAKALIIASGKRSRETCDGPLFSGQDVAVIGGGNSALDAAMQLTKIARQVTIINIAPSLTGDPVMQEKLLHNSRVNVLNNIQVTAILGDKMVHGVKVLKGGQNETLAVTGVFVEIGLIPNSYFAKDVAKNELGEIKVNSANETNIPGIFAAGDVTDVTEKQIIIAAGEGSKAALSAYRYIVHQG
ncbi:MAG: FAD-dependent oxidoreductase [Candidatus Omnitrophica bacterium]|nr:FAD-dependent oxidoreductase [Candidatus Omnitrophota bacterium]